MTGILDILSDERTITSVCSTAAPGDEWWIVGRAGVTKIVAYGEPGQHCYVPWFAVYVGDEIRTRIPAAAAIVDYAKAVPE